MRPKRGEPCPSLADPVAKSALGGATDAAAAEVHRMLENILAGIHGEATRADVRQKLAALLKA